jgi:YidC/Oxa1 family membrane protein insertase
MFTEIIVQPIFNLLVLIYALLPGHNFGLALIIFTVIIRLLLWPLVKKQLHQAKKMRSIQPELKRIAKEAKGDRQKQQLMQMELYKERGINPFGSIGVALLQLPILLGLYSGLQKVIHDKHQIYDFAYPALQQLSWMQHLKSNIHLFDATLFHIVDLSRPAVGAAGFYLPAFIIVVASAVTQYYQAKQLMPNDKDGRKLRDIMRDAGKGQQADQQDISAAIGRSTRFILPGMIFLFTINIASALGLYWFVGGLVAFIQQSIVLREDEEEMEALAAETGKQKKLKDIPEAEVVESKARKPAAVTESKKPAKVASAPKGGTTVTSITRSNGKKK